MSAPRRSAAEPNPAGTHALYTVSTYSFESHKHTSETRLFDLQTRQSTLITNEDGTSEPHWLDDQILYLKSGTKQSTELVVTSIDNLSANYTAALIPGPISDLKLKTLEKGKVALVAVGKAAKNGSLYNSELEEPKLSSSLLYDSLMVRHWDHYVKSEKNALFYGLFELSIPHATQAKGRYSLSPLQNALLGTDLESPIEPFPGGDHFDISSHGLIFAAKDPDLDPATNTKCNAYVLPITDFKLPALPSGPHKLELEGFEGAVTSPVFSPDGTAVAFLQMKENGYEADKNRLIVGFLGETASVDNAVEVLESDDRKGLWDRSPSSVLFSNDGKTLYLVASDEGIGALFSLDINRDPSKVRDLPEKITTTGSVSAVHRLGSSDKGVLFSRSSLVDNSIWSIHEPANHPVANTVSSNSRNGEAFGLSPSQVSSFWTKGAQKEVHSWVMKPSNFDANKKYPLAFLVHGGPQGSWDDSWSTRWNPATFAEQGYVVVAPNPTGSTGYGQEFTDAIQNSWGGLPYEDLVASFNHVKTSSNFSFVDTDRAVALGASYGGYMMNWISGQKLGREFLALVNHGALALVYLPSLIP